jgi:alanine racemase
MLNPLRKVFKREYLNLNRIEISRSNLIHNYRYLSSLHPHFAIAPVLKSNAYGHGMIEVAQILDSIASLQNDRVPFLCVDSLHEAYRIQKAGVKTPILIMGYINPENLKVKKLPFAYAVYDLEMLQVLNKYQKGASIHIKVDTGMHRLGVQLEQLPEFFDEVLACKNLIIEGIMSHFASAKSPYDPLYTNQLAEFEKALEMMSSKSIQPKWIHIAATEALINPKVNQDIPKVSNLARAGKALYGYSLTTDDPNLKPVLQLYTHIAQIKHIKKGDKVGYDGIFSATKDMTIAILPIGYNDGVDRRLSNKGSMKIGDVVCPIIGRVSMNITTIDISQVPDPHINQEVQVISSNPHDPNSILNLATLCDTIPHEILVHLDPTTKRVVVD